MTYYAFEAGSRAGFSAEKFFLSYLNLTDNDDRLIMVDSDKTFSRLKSHPNVERITEEEAIKYISKDDIVFPCDELTRQNNEIVRSIADSNYYSLVKKEWYDKSFVNSTLNGKSSSILIPKTMTSIDVFVKPNTMSAGSKGCHLLNNVCVSEYVNIEHEYVVDCEERCGNYKLFVREVKIKNGYDKYIKPISFNSKVYDKVFQFLADNIDFQLFKGIFHLQIAENVKGDLYYIESSKRISGSSIINERRGFNPFCFMNGIDETDYCSVKEGQWYRFEDLI